MEIRSRLVSKIAGREFVPMSAIGCSKNSSAPCGTAMFPIAECPAAAWDWQSRAASSKHTTAAFGWKMSKAEREQDLSSSCQPKVKKGLQLSRELGDSLRLCVLA